MYTKRENKCVYIHVHEVYRSGQVNEGPGSPWPTNVVRGLKQTCFVRGSKSPAEVFAESDEVGEALSQVRCTGKVRRSGQVRRGMGEKEKNKKKDDLGIPDMEKFSILFLPAVFCPAMRETITGGIFYELLYI